MGDPRRFFLGWDGPLLPRAADWLAGEFGEDLSELVIALPGARAGRALGDRLARRMPPTWRPPRVVTAGHLTDTLVSFEAPVASRFARTRAWALALRELPPAKLRRLVAEPPARRDELGWIALGAEVRAVFGELAAEGRTFADVLAGPAADAGPGERGRWDALRDAQADMERRLEALGLRDPHLERRRAIDAGDLDPSARVVLVGVADPGGLVRRLVERLGERATVLVGAPGELAGSFDACGGVDFESWSARETSLPLDAWSVVDDPAAQAEEAARVLASFGGAWAAEEVSLGLADPDVTPYVRRRLATHGIVGRDAAGSPVSRTGPARLLEAAARALRTGSFRDHAALQRHPDLARLLDLGRGDPPDPRDLGDPGDDLDRYHREHLPARVDRVWRGGVSRIDSERGGRLERRGAALDAVLGEVGARRARRLTAWLEPVRELLTRVYGGRELDLDAREGDRRLAGALDRVGVALDALADVPAELAPSVAGHEALRLVLDELAATRIPPTPERESEPTIEMLGWLELALDEAPALVITGFNEGRVPERLSHPAWLPSSARAALGLEDGERRLARDLYLLEWMLASKDRVHVVSGRRTLEGDPLLPSRLALRVSAERIAARVRHVLPRDGGARAGGAGVTRDIAPFRPAVRADAAPPTALGVTAFGTYLASPYLFYLRHVERLDTLDDREEELDGRTFGNLAHQVLEDFGRSALVASADAEAIERDLERRLRALAETRFGDVAHPAVALQLEQLVWRLGLFARRQAARAREGWRIEHVEWSTPKEGLPLDVDGEPFFLKGKIDRIDRHTSGRWAVLDYKTGDKASEPRKAHRDRSGAWKDLQLPLYAWLARGIVGEEPPELGYVALGRSEREIGFRAETWPGDDLSAALDEAKRVVRAVRAREWVELGRPRNWDPVFRALCGEGLLGGAAVEVQEGGND